MSSRRLFRRISSAVLLVTDAVNTMTENTPDGSMAASEGGAKKELSYDQLKAYVHKARVKIKKLEQEKESFKEQADKSSASQTASAGLVKSLREEVELWKTNYQQQVEAAATEAPNGKSAHDASNSESESLRQDFEEARQEATLWKEKALESQETQVRFLALKEELNEARISSERAEQELRASHEKEVAELESKNRKLASAKAKMEAELREEIEAAQNTCADLQTEIDTLLHNAGALEHRLLTTQQERDHSLARASELELEVKRLGADAGKASDVVKEAMEARDRALEESVAVRSELDALKERHGVLEEELDVARKERDSMEDRACGVETEACALRSEVDSGKERLAGVEAERDEALKVKEEEQKAKAAAKELAEELSRGLAAAQEELQAERGALSARLSESEGMRSTSEDEARTLREKNGALEEQVDELQKRLEEASAALETRNLESSARDRETMQTASERVAESEGPNEGDPSARTMAARAELEELEQKKASTDREVKELEEKLERMRDKHSEEGGASGEEERRAREALLEDRLRAAESSVEGSKQAAGEMEGVVARLREEEAALEARVLELTSEVSAAKEAASVAQDDLAKEKEEARVLGERASAAETLVKELQENREGTEEGFVKEKVALEERVLELTSEVSSAREAASVAQEGLVKEKEEARVQGERASTAEALLKELQGNSEGTKEGFVKEKAVLEARVLELTSEVSAAREAASVAREGLVKEKEEARVLGERASAAEALVKELQENREGTEEGFVKEKAALEARVLELTSEVSAAKEAVSVAQQGLMKEKEDARVLGEKALAAEALVKELQENREGTEEGFVKEKAALEARVLELTSEMSAAKEAASVAQDDLAKEKEEARVLGERVSAAEALVKELQEKMKNTEEGFLKDKAALEARLEEAARETASWQQAMTESSSSAAAASSAAASSHAERAKVEEECSRLQEQVTAQKEKLSKAVARMRSLKSEKEKAAEGMASRTALLEESKKNLEDANGGCQALQEALDVARAALGAAREEAAVQTADGGERLSVVQEELEGLRQQMATATRNAAEEAKRLHGELQERGARLEEAKEALRSAAQSAARVPALQGDLEAERARRRELEDEVRALREGLRQMEKVKEAASTESEEIMKALQGQVDSANKERDAAASGIEAARQAKEVIGTKLFEVSAEAQSQQAKLETVEEENAKLKTEAGKVVDLEEKIAELSSKVQDSETKLAEALVTLRQCEIDLARTVAEKEKTAEAGKSTKEDLETKVKRLKTLLSKLQKSNQSKDADISALKAPPPPKAFVVEMRVRHLGSVWCFLRAVPPQEAPASADESDATQEESTGEGGQKQWVNEDKARAWMAGGTSRSDDSQWPTVVQEELEKKVVASREEATAAVARAEAKQADLDALTNDFAKYKARAHTALKKATSSGADGKRKDEVIADLNSERDRLTSELEESRASFEKQIAEATNASKLKEDDLQSVSEQLDAAQEQVRDLEGSLRDQERKMAQLQETEDGYSEELSTLRETIDDLKSQLKAARAQATESSCIVQRLQDELEMVAREREANEGRRGSWDPRSDGGWAGQQILDSRQGPRGSAGEPSQGFADQRQLSEDAMHPPVPGTPVSMGVNGLVGGVRQGDTPTYIPGVSAQPVHLVAVAELERRQTNVESNKQAEVSEMRTELAEALLRVEQLSEQEKVLKATVRALEADLKTERDLGSGEYASVNVAYLKSALVRYMSTRDSGEQRSLLRVISTILQLTKMEVDSVEARIAELEKTMMGRAGNMVGGAGRRVGGVVGGVVGLVWRGGGKEATGPADEVEYGLDEAEGEKDGQRG